MKLPGIVTNVTNFGAFVDVGVHQDGLVHVSHLADTFVKDPTEVVKVQQPVQVTVMEVDLPRKRISLSMKSDPFDASAPEKRSAKPRRKEAAPAGRPAEDGRPANQAEKQVQQGVTNYSAFITSLR